MGGAAGGGGAASTTFGGGRKLTGLNGSATASTMGSRVSASRPARAERNGGAPGGGGGDVTGRAAAACAAGAAAAACGWPGGAIQRQPMNTPARAAQAQNARRGGQLICSSDNTS